MARILRFARVCVLNHSSVVEGLTTKQTEKSHKSLHLVGAVVLS